MYTSFINFDLFSVGISMGAIAILGFAVFFSNRKSITNKSFLFFAFLTILYGTLNYSAYRLVNSADLILWLLRLTIFSAVFHAFSFMQLFYVFPSDTMKFSKQYRYIFIPLTILVAFLTLTPLVFSHIDKVAPYGEVTNPVRGPGIILFGAAVTCLVLYGIFLLITKTIKASGIEKVQLKFVLTGAALTFFLILTFNFILPVIFNNLRFISLAPVFLLPFTVFTAYAIIKHHLLDIKIIATEILTFILSAITLFEVLISQDIWLAVLRAGISLLIFSFGILLIRSVRKEVEQREQLQELSQKLAAANKQLTDLSHFKSQLLSLASHQIKSPLAAIKGFASILIEGLYGPLDPKVKETLGKMMQSTNDLIGLVNSLLDLRKVEEGRMEYQFAKTDIGGIAKMVVDQLQPLATEKKLQLTFRAPQQVLYANADSQKLRQVFQNLIDNSIKYTPEGFVRVSLDGQVDGIVLSVVDSGLGMAPALIPQLFAEFVRDDRVKKEIRGTGLGLYIARKIIEAHGGRVWAQSEGEGKGSQFYVWLPRVS